MKLLKKLKKLFPVYRMGEGILNRLSGICKQINGTNNRIAEINNRIDELDVKLDYFFFFSQHLATETPQETKERVFLTMPPATGELRLIQLGCNYVLSQLKQVCDENGIEFFLSDGTLIGAVRHHGFIPWDDDIDTGIFRKDVNKLKEALKNNSDLCLVRYYNYNKNDKRHYSVLKVKSRTFEHLFVDVFVYDLFDSADMLEYSRYCEANSAFHREFARIMEERHITEFDGYIPKPVPELDEEYEKLEEKYSALVNRKTEGDMFALAVGNFESYVNKMNYMKCNMFLPLEKNALQFENVYYTSIKNPVMYLNIQYGDIWTLPRTLVCRHSEQVLISDCERKFITENLMKSDKHGF